jgi:hypothetical protein
MLHALILSTVVSVATMVSGHFPEVSGKNLNGKAFTLPRDFGAPVNLVFIAYKREQQADVDSWQSAAERATVRRPEVAIWEVPTLSRGNAFFRGFIDGGMRRGIPDERVRAKTITLYIDKAPFNATLGIASENTITVLLMRSGGEILWRATGRYAVESGAALDAALAAL